MCPARRVLPLSLCERNITTFENSWDGDLMQCKQSGNYMRAVPTYIRAFYFQAKTSTANSRLDRCILRCPGWQSQTRAPLAGSGSKMKSCPCPPGVCKVRICALTAKSTVNTPTDAREHRRSEPRRQHLKLWTLYEATGRKVFSG